MAPITHPVALDDQLQAATADTGRIFHTLADATGMDVTATDATDWFAGRLTALIDDVCDGSAQLCPHLSQGPRPAFTAFWRPGLAVCEACTGQLSRPEHAPGCDRCGADPEFVDVHQVQVEALLVLYALCDNCTALEEAESGAPQQ